jgi:hypothetical protein
MVTERRASGYAMWSARTRSVNSGLSRWCPRTGLQVPRLNVIRGLIRRYLGAIPERGMNTVANSDPGILRVRITKDEIIADLADGRVIGVGGLRRGSPGQDVLCVLGVKVVAAGCPLRSHVSANDGWKQDLNDLAAEFFPQTVGRSSTKSLQMRKKWYWAGMPALQGDRFVMPCVLSVRKAFRAAGRAAIMRACGVLRFPC